MRHTKNPLVVKDEFMTVLISTGQDITSLGRLLNYFCDVVWQLDDERFVCYEKLKDLMLSLPSELKKVQIPRLIDSSKSYPFLVFLAEELFNSLDFDARKGIKISMIYWTKDDKYTSISEKEYLYRQAKGQKVWISNGDYRRPVTKEDLICFEKVLEMMFMSGNSECFYLNGYED